MKPAGALLVIALAACGGPLESKEAIQPFPTPEALASAAASVPPPAASSVEAASTPSAAAPPSKISARHVLIQWMGAEHAGPSVVRTRDQAMTVAEEVLRRAKAGEDISRLAVEYSDEPNAAQRGGSLGRFGHGAMVPAFEDAAFKLKIGETSGIVETGFGYHIIQRTE